MSQIFSRISKNLSCVKDCLWNKSLLHSKMQSGYFSVGINIKGNSDFFKSTIRKFLPIFYLIHVPFWEEKIKKTVTHNVVNGCSLCYQLKKTLVDKGNTDKI